MSARLTDFGMARAGPDGGETHISTRVMGTMGYLDPTYMETGMLPEAIWRVGLEGFYRNTGHWKGSSLGACMLLHMSTDGILVDQYASLVVTLVTFYLLCVRLQGG